MADQLISSSLDDTIAILSKRVESLLVKLSNQPNRRIMIALAGVPGSGKSTVSAMLLASLRQRDIDNVELVPMDGFHFSKKTLSTFPCPTTALHRRGAPFTFDADAFAEAVASIQRCFVTLREDPRLALRLPSFDHAMQDPVQDDIYVPSSARVVIIEGNYLLLDECPWNKAVTLFDEKWFVDVPPATAKSRLIDRHLKAGIEQSREAAALRVEKNDLQNGITIRSRLIRPDVIITN